MRDSSPPSAVTRADDTRCTTARNLSPYERIRRSRASFCVISKYSLRSYRSFRMQNSARTRPTHPKQYVESEQETQRTRNWLPVQDFDSTQYAQRLHSSHEMHRVHSAEFLQSTQ